MRGSLFPAGRPPCDGAIRPDQKAALAFDSAISDGLAAGSQDGGRAIMKTRFPNGSRKAKIVRGLRYIPKAKMQLARAYIRIGGAVAVVRDHRRVSL
jgi:hypothetical protein